MAGIRGTGAAFSNAPCHKIMACHVKKEASTHPVPLAGRGEMPAVSAPSGGGVFFPLRPLRTQLLPAPMSQATRPGIPAGVGTAGTSLVQT